MNVRTEQRPRAPAAIVPAKPPAPTAPAVRKHLQTLELLLDALKASAAALALASARAEPGAQAALAALHGKILAAEFEISCNPAARILASKEDSAAEASWREAIQTMDPEEIIAGLSKEGCCHRCTPGINGGCVITASAPYAGDTCGHPVRSRHLFPLDEAGRTLFPYRMVPRALEIYLAASRRLKVHTSPTARP
jgi:hypothetical protein